MVNSVNRRQFLRTLGTCGTAALAAPEWFRQEALAAPTLLGYPYLQDVRSDRATIMWNTLQSGTGMVLYASEGGSSFVARADRRFFPTSETRLTEPFYQHKAVLTELDPGNFYSIETLLDGTILTASGAVRFRTSSSGPFQFLAFGDSGMATGQQAQIAQLMNREASAALVLHTGDIAYMDGTYLQFRDRYFQYYWEIMRRIPFFPVAGNHEYYTDYAAPYIALHSVPTDNVPVEGQGRYYSFDWGNAHFVALDSYDPLARAVTSGGAMLDWLEKDLSQTRKFWRIVYFHHPPFATGNNERDYYSGLVRDYVAPILDRYGVNLVLNGHEHSYQRSWPIRNRRIVAAGKGTVYVVTGGGGADLYAVPPGPNLAFGASVFNYVRTHIEGHRLTLEAIRNDGVRFDTLTLEPPPSVASVYPLQGSPTGVPQALVSGELICINGRYLAAEEAVAGGTPLPAALGGLEVTLGGIRLPLVTATSVQVHAGIPAGMSGEMSLKATNPNGSAETQVWVVKKSSARRR